MKYNEKEFKKAVSEYKKKLKGFKNKNMLVIFEPEDKEAFYSIAPLSMAVHELGSDMHVISKNSNMLQVLFDVWDAFCTTDKLDDFISIVDKKAKGKFKKLFQKPDAIIKSNNKHFEGSFELPYHTGWFKEYAWDSLLDTAENLWKNCYNLKKGERVSVGFELVPAKKHLELPLEDYLDSYSIVRAMAIKAKDKGAVRMGAATCRWSMLDASERISDLKSTLLGCELDKDVKEPVFMAYKKVSKELKLSRIKAPDVSFFIVAKGYPGKHLFGELIGYPTLDGKSRWNSPGGIIYQFDWYPQTKFEKRKPQARVGFTETLPIDIFVDSCNVDYELMRERNHSIMKIMDQSEFIHVEGEKIKGLKTDFNVYMKMNNGKHRWPRDSSSDVRTKINPFYKKREGIEAGRMANHPGGEAFVTPEYIEGKIIGDVVISLDRSYVIPKNKPIVIESSKKGYKVLKGDKKILAAFEKKKRESWKRILDQEKSGAVPTTIIDIKKRNFKGMGEFAINTNPAAKLCDYLIVNEKIANMIHVAMGSGFEPDKATEYHTDVVIDAPRQKLDIYGVDEEGDKLWILRKGEFVI